MKLLASADHHFHERLRFEECRAIHSWMVDLARDEKVDGFVSAGDVYEGASSPIEREAVADWLVPMAEGCPVVVVKGNHDKRLDCHLLSRLRSRHPIIVEERAAVHYVAGAAIAAMAWPERSGLLAALGSQEATDIGVREALQAVLRGLGDQLEQFDGPRILLGHFMADGAMTSVGQPLLGQPINVSLADLALARAHLGLMGHIHMFQEFDVGGAPHLYTGSSFRTDFGQLEKKTVTIAEFDGPRLVRLRHIETPCTPMLHAEDEWGVDPPDFPDPYWRVGDMPENLSGAEIRFRYRVRADMREGAARAAEEWCDRALAMGAKSVKVEPVVITERRARAPEVARAEGIRDKLTAHWASIGFDPGERRESLLSKAAVLEQEARDAS